METFEEMIIESQKERQKGEWFSANKKRVDGEYIYLNFCVWCNAYKNGAGKRDYRIFEQYIKENNIVANWWQRKRIYENYFGFKFEYKENKWIRVK